MSIVTSANAGVFTCAALQKITVEVDKIWADNVQARDYISKVEALRAIRTEQTATISELQDPEKDNIVKIIWPADCTTGTEACGDDCTVGGAQPESGCKDMELNLCQQRGFSITEKQFRTMNGTREQYVAKSMAKAMKELDEYLAQSAVSALESAAGKNKYLGGIGDPDNNSVTYIAPSYWTADVYGYFYQVQIMNQFPDVYMLHGSNLFQMNWQAQMNSSNPENSGAKMIGSIRSYWDMFNVDSVAAGKTSYMISRGAMAFVNKAYYPLNNPINYLFGQRWSIESKALPGVYYDVYYNNECVAGGNGDVKYNWLLRVKAGIFNNPLGCDTDVTGVIKFVCGENAGS